MKFKITFLIILTTIALTLAACNRKNAPGDVLFSDDFSNSNSGWNQISDRTDYKTAYKDGSYQILVNTPRSNGWGNPGNLSFTDVRIEVDATKASGSDDNDFGIICRYQDLDNFYLAQVSSDGYYGILKISSGQFDLLGYDTLELLTTNLVKPGNESNHLRLDCVGSTLSLYINDTFVEQQTDTEFTSGNVGLIAGTYDVSGTEILFDNFFVYEPDQLPYPYP